MLEGADLNKQRWCWRPAMLAVWDYGRSTPPHFPVDVFSSIWHGTCFVFYTFVIRLDIEISRVVCELREIF